MSNGRTKRIVDYCRICDKFIRFEDSLIIIDGYCFKCVKKAYNEVIKLTPEENNYNKILQRIYKQK